MGGGESKAVSSGALPGARVEPRGPVPLPEGLHKEFDVVVPKGVAIGSTFQVSVDGTQKTIKAFVRPGERQRMKMCDTSSIVASTLHAAPPGFRIELQMPIIWATYCESFYFQGTSSNAQTAASRTGPLLRQVQAKLLEQAGAANCNAVLGCSFAISTDSSGEHGYRKLLVRA
jgi:hypothetical protein